MGRGAAPAGVRWKRDHQRWRTDRHGAGRAHGLQPRQRQHQLVAAFAFGQSVNLVHHHPLHTLEHARRVFVAGEQRQRLRGRQKNMWRIGALPFLDVLRGVTGAILDPDRQTGLVNRGAQVALDVCGQCLERADVKRVQPVARRLGQLCERRQEPGQRLATPGRRDQQKAWIVGAVQHVLLMRMDGPPTRVEPRGKGGRKGSHRLYICHAGPKKTAYRQGHLPLIAKCRGSLSRRAALRNAPRYSCISARRAT